MKFDFRTAAVMLVVFALGYAVALAMPVAQAEVGDPVVIDRLVVTNDIRFVHGPRLTGDGNLYIEGIVHSAAYNGDGYQVHGVTVLTQRQELQNVTILSSVLGGSALDVGKLGGHTASDFVLKSEIDSELCQTFCPIIPDRKD